MNVKKSFLAWRERGLASKPNFVWQFGVLMFGVTFGLVFSLILVIISNQPLWEKVLIVAGMTVVVGPVAGWVWGQFMWAIRWLWLRPRESSRSHR